MERRLSLVFALAAFLASGLAAADLPRFELGIGGGFTRSMVDCGFSNPGSLIYYNDFPLYDYETVDGDPDTHQYSLSEQAFSANSLLLVRFLRREGFALAYSSRLAFSFGKAIHRADYYEDYDTVLSLYGLTGLEAELYLSGKPTGPWISVLGGLSLLNQPFVAGYLTQLGWGAGASLGWRFTRRLALELNGFYAHTSIPGTTIGKISDAASGASLYGDMYGYTLAAGLRFGF